MKHFILFVLISISLMSCIPQDVSKIKPEDYSKYVKTDWSGSSAQYSYSPVAYNMIRGENKFQDYNWRAVQVTSYWFTYVAGDKAKIVELAFPNADAIIEYQNYYFIGVLRK